jgi:hypothetical protein
MMRVSGTESPAPAKGGSVFTQIFGFTIRHGADNPRKARQSVQNAAHQAQNMAYRTFRFGEGDEAPIGRLFIKASDKVTPEIGGVLVTVEMNLPYFDGERGIAYGQAEQVARDVCGYLGGSDLTHREGDAYDDR